MADGKTHDQFGAATFAGTTAIASLILPDPLLLIYGASSLAGFLLIGPDLDCTNLRISPIRRWGPLRFLWIPYAKMMHPHRGPTHTPFIGAMLPILWLHLLVGSVWIGLMLMGVGIPPFDGWDELWACIKSSAKAELVAYTAVTIQQLVHLALDGILPQRMIRLLKEGR